MARRALPLFAAAVLVASAGCSHTASTSASPTAPASGLVAASPSPSVSEPRAASPDASAVGLLAASPDASAVGLLAAYAKTLDAGPTHFIATRTGGPSDPSTYVGVEDFGHNAAEYVQDSSGLPTARLAIAGVTYTCNPRGPTTIVFTPGYCDASSPWLLYAGPSATDPAKLLRQVLVGEVGASGWISSADPVRNLGQASIRGVAVTGYAFNLNAAAMNGALQSAPIPAHDANAVVHVWLDATGLVREFRLDFVMTVPGLGSPVASDNNGLPADVTPLPNPSLAAQQQAMKVALPAADRDVAPPAGFDQLSVSTTVQLWDFGAAAPIQAPPSAAVKTQTLTRG